MLLLTIAIIIVLFIISFFLFDRDLLAPPTVVALVLLFGCLCCLYNETRWGLEFAPQSMGLIASGIVATMIGGIIGVYLSNLPKKVSYSFNHDKSELEEIRINRIKTFAVIVFQIITMIMIFQHIRNLTGYSDWMSAVSEYRLMTGRLADPNDPSIRMTFLVRNMGEISKLMGMVYAYIVGNNIIASKRIISTNWIPIILYATTTFMQGDRSNVIRMWIVALVTMYTVHKRKVGWKKSRETKKIILTMMISVIAVGVLFVVIREFVGRVTDMDPLYYVTFYAGSPTAVLNQMWEGAIVAPDNFGQRTLFYLNQSTTALFGWPGRYNFYYPFFRSPNGTLIGNAPTALRPAFTEFGLWGFLAFMICCGAFFTFLYCLCRKKRGKSSIDLCLLIYAYISYVFFMYFYSTFFDFLSHLLIKYIIEFLLIRWFLVGWQFKERPRLLFYLRDRKRD